MRCAPVLIALLILAACQRPDPAAKQAEAAQALVQRQSGRVLELLSGDHSPEAERLKATARLQLNDLGAAAEHLDAGIAAGGSAAVYADYARLELIRGDLARAEAMQAKSEQGGDTGLATLLTGGEIALARKQPDRALGYFDRAAALYPDNLAVLSNRAQSLAELSRWSELAPLITELERRLPDDPEVAALRQRLVLRR